MTVTALIGVCQDAFPYHITAIHDNTIEVVSETGATASLTLEQIGQGPWGPAFAQDYPQQGEARELATTDGLEAHDELQQPFEDREYQVQEMFEQIQAEPNPAHKPEYFLENPPQSIPLNEAAIDRYTNGFAQPFLLLTTDGQVYANPRVAPYAYDNPDAASLEELNNSTDPRYTNAEVATNYDSGVFALAASSAPNTEGQARLYQAISNAILEIHQQRPQLLTDWINAQRQQQEATEITSLDVFIVFDHADGNLNLLRHENERLLAFASPDQFNNTWQTRMNELTQALNDNHLQPHHLRWIEFLSHSINVAQMVEDLKGQGTTGSDPDSPPPPSGPDETNSPQTGDTGTTSPLDAAAADAQSELTVDDILNADNTAVAETDIPEQERHRVNKYVIT